MCNTLSGIGAGFLTGGGGLLFQAYDIEAFCDKEVMLNILCDYKIKSVYLYIFFKIGQNHKNKLIIR